MDGNPPADRDVAGLAPRSANALRRGLAARKVLPPDLAQTVRSLRDAFVVELKPTSTLQEILVSELARHAGAMQHAADFEAAVLRAAHKQAGALENLLDTDSVPDPDDRIAAMLISESVERAMRYRRGHERAFHAALARLRESQNERLDDALAALRFETEATCTTWLASWQREQIWVCPGCDGRERRWLQTRGGWECGCGKLFSLRYGTVFSGSHITLQQWFSAVIELIANPHLSTGMLCGRIGLTRRGTACRVMKQIRAALIDPAASSRLAGLNDLVAGHLEQVARKSERLQNKNASRGRQSSQAF